MNASTRFYLREFDIDHHQSSMKIGTDALLLGAWCPIDRTEKRVLDIGSGCGIISLMLAQRMPEAQILGIDIHQPSIMESQSNAYRSSWSDRIKFINANITHFQCENHFDLIVSNPPYHQALWPKGVKRRLARHQSTLSAYQLLSSVIRLTNPSGRFSLIIPAQDCDAWLTEAEKHGMHPRAMTTVTHKSGGNPKRVLIELGNEAGECALSQLIIGADGSRTPDYRALMEPYLA